jgi:hypothetical protein
MGEPVDPNAVPPARAQWSGQWPGQWAQQPYPGQPAGPYGGPAPYSGYPGYPGYPPPPPMAKRDTRPGQAMASAVLAYVLGGLLILAGILLMFGASLADSVGDAIGEDTGAITTELVIDGLVNLAAAGLLIAGGVSLTTASRSGRSLLGWGAGITLAASIYWLIRASGAAGTVVYVVAFDALAIIAIALMAGPAVSGWLAAHRAGQRG